MVVLETVCVAFAMFSALPVPHVDWNERNMRYAMAAFPLVGAVIGFAIWKVKGGALTDPLSYYDYMRDRITIQIYNG